MDIFHRKTQKRSHADYQVTDAWCDRTSKATDRKKRPCVSSHAAYPTRLIKEGIIETTGGSKKVMKPCINLWIVDL